MNGTDREWQLLQRQLDRIEDKLDKKVDKEEFWGFRKETVETITSVEEDIQEIRTAAITPDQITNMVGHGLQTSQARGWTQRDRAIRYGLAILSILTCGAALWGAFHA